MNSFYVHGIYRKKGDNQAVVACVHDLSVGVQQKCDFGKRT